MDIMIKDVKHAQVNIKIASVVRKIVTIGLMKS